MNRTMNWLKMPGPFGFPRYGWMAAIGAFLIAGYIFYRNRGKSSKQSPTINPSSSGMMPVSYPYSTSPGDGSNFPSAPPIPPTNYPSASSGIETFTQWLQHAFDGSRPDLAAAVKAGRWSDLYGQYSKEAAAAQQQMQSASTIVTPTNQIMSGSVLGKRSLDSSQMMSGFRTVQPPGTNTSIGTIGNPPRSLTAIGGKAY